MNEVISRAKILDPENLKPYRYFKDNYRQYARKSGIYLWYFRIPKDYFPNYSNTTEVLKDNDRWALLYIGKAKQNTGLSARIVDWHFEGRSGPSISTLRFSLSTLLRYSLQFVHKDSSGRYELSDENNQKLTQFMIDEARVAVFEIPESLIDGCEADLINRHRTLLNIKNNPENPFFTELLDMRSKAKQEAKAVYSDRQDIHKKATPRKNSKAKSQPDGLHRLPVLDIEQQKGDKAFKKYTSKQFVIADKSILRVHLTYRQTRFNPLNILRSSKFKVILRDAKTNKVAKDAMKECRGIFVVKTTSRICRQSTYVEDVIIEQGGDYYLEIRSKSLVNDWRVEVLSSALVRRLHQRLQQQP